MPILDRFAGPAAALAWALSAAPIALFVAPAHAQVVAGVSVSAPIAPPLLPVYAQPPVPGPGYIWIPGYWAWNGTGYYWAPGTWVAPPQVGLLWTPPYWGWSSGVYAFHPGYWGPTVGFYGGVNYGFGYTGVGFAGGYWNNGVFNYNTAVTNVGNAQVDATYNAPVAINRTTNTANVANVSYNGGPGGTTAVPTTAQQAYAVNEQQHAAPPAAQVQHQQAAFADPALSYANNKGAPPIAATARPGDFEGAVTRGAALAPVAAPASAKAGTTAPAAPATNKTATPAPPATAKIGTAAPTAPATNKIATPAAPVSSKPAPTAPTNRFASAPLHIRPNGRISGPPGAHYASRLPERPLSRPPGAGPGPHPGPHFTQAQAPNGGSHPGPRPPVRPGPHPAQRPGPAPRPAGQHP
jgi:hypothetical protein